MQKALTDVRPSFMKWLAIPVKTFSRVDTITTYSIDSFCVVLYCIVLYCIVLYCIVLYCIVLYCIVNKKFICLYLLI
jgi:hypothetical protein